MRLACCLSRIDARIMATYDRTFANKNAYTWHDPVCRLPPQYPADRAVPYGTPRAHWSTRLPPGDPWDRACLDCRFCLAMTGMPAMALKVAIRPSAPRSARQAPGSRRRTSALLPSYIRLTWISCEIHVSRNGPSTLRPADKEPL